MALYIDVILDVAAIEAHPVNERDIEQLASLWGTRGR
jgi:hypothetical protein